MIKTYTHVVLSSAAAIIILSLTLGVIARRNQFTVVRTHLMEATYPTFDSLGQLAARSTVIVRGEVTKLQPTRRVIPEVAPVADMPREKVESVGYLLTDVEVRVDHVLAGPANLLKRTIVVPHLGGETAKDRFVMGGEPLSIRGRSYLFFLERTEDGQYVMVGGPQGRFLIHGKQLKAISDEVRGSAIGTELDGRQVGLFERNFDTIVRDSKPTPARAERQEPARAQPQGGSGIETKPDGPSATN